MVDEQKNSETVGQRNLRLMEEARRKSAGTSQAAKKVKVEQVLHATQLEAQEKKWTEVDGRPVSVVHNDMMGIIRATNMNYGPDTPQHGLGLDLDSLVALLEPNGSYERIFAAYHAYRKELVAAFLPLCQKADGVILAGAGKVAEVNPVIQRRVDLQTAIGKATYQEQVGSVEERKAAKALVKELIKELAQLDMPSENK